MQPEAVRRAPVSAPTLPSGIVAFLFTDIEGSTARWDRYPEAMREALRRHDVAMRAAVARYDGYVFKTVGDAFCVAFHRASDAVAAAIDAQRTLADLDFAAVGGLKVRMAIHADASDEREGDYFGPPLNRVARLVAIGHGGQVLLSKSAAELAGPALPPGAALRDLGEHRLKDLTQAERVFQLAAHGLEAEFRALCSLDVVKNNLPLALSPLIGRDEDVRDVVADCGTARLVTLVGAGGIGKTRVALQAGAELTDSMPDGVWFVDLAPLTGGTYVAETIASVLDIAPVPGRSIVESIVGALKAQRLLLILDNCEHVIADAALVAETIVRAVPGATILATSREPLAVAGECVSRLPTLTVPAPNDTVTADTALHYGAVALFVARAAAADRRFVLSDDNAAVVADIVRRLDGIALAIELAAARVTVLTVANLASRLDERFRLLTGGSRTALPRQRTMRALIDWSWDMLSERDRVVLRRVGVFTGGWTLEAAERVCADDGLDAFDLMDALGSLVDKSLVTSETVDGESRSRLLETTRAYAIERLEESGERDALLLRHATWAAEFSERMFGTYDGSPNWLASVEAELDNARGALRWAIDANRGVVAARIATHAYSGYWWYRSPDEGLGWAERILACVDRDAEPFLTAELYRLTGCLTAGRRAVDAYQRAVAILDRLADGDAASLASAKLTNCLAGLAAWLMVDGRIGDALAAVERSLAICERRGSTQSRAYANALVQRGRVLAEDGNAVEARASLDAARAMFTSLDEGPGVAVAVLALADVEFVHGDMSRASALAHEADGIFEALVIPTGAADALGVAAACALRLGLEDEVRTCARSALDRARSAQTEAPTTVLLTVATFACERGDEATAATLLGFVEDRERRQEAPLTSTAAVIRARLRSRIERVLGDAELLERLREGSTFHAPEAHARVRSALERHPVANYPAFNGPATL